VLTLRESGAVFRAIGQEFGISSGRAGQLYRQAVKKREHEHAGKLAQLRRERTALRQLATDLWEHRACGIPETGLWCRICALVPGFHGVRPVDAEGVSIQRDGDYEIKQEK